MTQKQVAGEIRVDETSVFNWESNRVQPAVRLIPHIIRFLGYCPYTPGLPVSEWLKLFRKSVGYSQERMAQLLGVDEGTWRRWEVGLREPSPEYLGNLKTFKASTVA